MKKLITTFACFVVVAGSVLAGVAGADPANDQTLTYYFEKCGKVKPFYAVKQPSGAASFTLVDGSGTFVVKEAEVLGDQTVDGTFYPDGTVLFETPGFSTGKNGQKTVTCTSLSPESGILARVTGSFSK
jgi:hypothetical protein